MRVVHIITRLIVGGAQENTIATVVGLKRKSDVEVSLISGPTYGPEGSLVHKVDSTPGFYHEVPELIRPIHPIKDLIALRKLVGLLKKLNPDIVHTHSGKAGFLGRLAAKIANTPIIIHTIHGPSFGEFQSAVPNLVYIAAERIAGKFTTAFIAVSEAMIDRYLAAGIGRKERYNLIYSGFKLEPYISAKNDPVLRKSLGIAPDDIVITKIARLFKLKGHEDLFKIAPELVKRFKNVKFLIVGGGEWKEKYVALSKQLNLNQNVIFTDLVPPEQIPDVIGITDILVHLSRREGLARSLVQALAGSKPVIAYDCDGAREVCIDGKTGFLIKPGDTNRLFEAIAELVSKPSLRESMGKTGQSFVIENFAEEKMIDSIYNLYNQILRRNS
ncbi:MAG: glycosyltransferase family 4 protein [Verrucomicrobiia bacterium]|jgi:glycosyltransferase involved in cell wall biosynthesis